MQPTFEGTVWFAATIATEVTTFPAIDYKPDEPGVAWIGLEGPDGRELRCVVHLDAVANVGQGLEIARRAIDAALTRIAYHCDLSIEGARMTAKHFAPSNRSPGLHAVEKGDTAGIAATSARPVVPTGPSDLRAKLEQASPPGELYFEQYRQALRSTGHVETFMQLYRILLELCGSQEKVDEFICKHESGVEKTLSKRKDLAKKGVKETIYTRLRNQVGHQREGADADQTRDEMAVCLKGLMRLTKCAIEERAPRGGKRPATSGG